jgi:hypothetical protein
LRLASLLWRLSRIISIETDLLKIQSDIARERRRVFRGPRAGSEDESSSSAQSTPFVFDPEQKGPDSEDAASLCGALPMSVRDLTCCFLRLSNVDNGAFERLGRHNATLWKQTAQTLFLLHAIKRP